MMCRFSEYVPHSEVYDSLNEMNNGSLELRARRNQLLMKKREEIDSLFESTLIKSGWSRSGGCCYKNSFLIYTNSKQDISSLYRFRQSWSEVLGGEIRGFRLKN